MPLLSSASHRFHVVEPIADQLLCVLPVGRILWHGLHRCQDLWVENPQTLREQQSSRLAWNKQKTFQLFCGVRWCQLESVNQPWWTITACSVTMQSTTLGLSLRCSLSAAHLMWIVGHCQADQASRLQENSNKEMFEKSGSLQLRSFLRSITFELYLSQIPYTTFSAIKTAKLL